MPSVLFLSSFPPRECGIATFTSDLVGAIDREEGSKSDVIAVNEPGGDLRRYPARVYARFDERDRQAYSEIAARIDAHPATILNIQHEYGLFGGERGEWLVDLVRQVAKPTVITMHTVLPEPDAVMLRVARSLCDFASAVVSLSDTGRDLLERVYGVNPVKLHVIPHGVPDVPFRETAAAKASFGIGQRTVISTFGLINRGKGLEYAIDAMAAVVRRHPEALYLILGETHPVVRRQEGESYRESLQELVAAKGLRNNVHLIDKYLSLPELLAYLEATDIYLTPYLNLTQIVSGTLAYALGCGKAIVSTPYLYAQELLAFGRGRLAEVRDAGSIALQLTALLDDPSLRRATERRAYRYARSMTWHAVANAYERLFSELTEPRPASLAHTA